MRLHVKNEHRPGFRAPRKTLSSIASWLVVAPLISLIAVTSTATTANAVSANPTPVCSGANCTITFSGTSDYYSYIVPSGMTSLDVSLRGGQGGGSGGQGGVVAGKLTVTPGSTLFVYVGAAGTQRFDLRALELDAGLEGLDDLVIVAGAPVVGDDLDAILPARRVGAAALRRHFSSGGRHGPWHRARPSWSARRRAPAADAPRPRTGRGGSRHI